MDHPNILKLRERAETEAHTILVQELAPKGELFEYLLTNGKLGEEESRALFTQLISAVEYCHGRNVCHRDIKPENILLGARGEVKLADFGFATQMHCISNGSHGWADTSCGSPHYASPEVIEGARYQVIRALMMAPS
jgi:serine/threonine protein kinase